MMQLLNSLSADSSNILESFSCKTDTDSFRYPLILLMLSDSGLAKPIHILCNAWSS